MGFSDDYYMPIPLTGGDSVLIDLNQWKDMKKSILVVTLTILSQFYCPTKIFQRFQETRIQLSEKIQIRCLKLVRFQMHLYIETILAYTKCKLSTGRRKDHRI